MLEENTLRGSLTGTNEAKGGLGFKGETGMSAYELAVKNGYEGTEQQWIDHFGLDLTGYLKTSDVVDSLTSTYTTKPLSANQGKELYSTINSVNNSLISLVTYSDEGLVGYWTDNKPIYRKIITLENVTSGSSSENISSIGIDKVVNMRFIANHGTNYDFSDYYSSASDYLRVFYRNNSGNQSLEIRLSSTETYTIEVILDYTLAS